MFFILAKCASKVRYQITFFVVKRAPLFSTMPHIFWLKIFYSQQNPLKKYLIFYVSRYGRHLSVFLKRDLVQFKIHNPFCFSISFGLFERITENLEEIIT